MSDKFIVRHKSAEEHKEKSVTMSLRLDRALQAAYDQLAQQSGRSRNELMCMALQYALDHLEFVPE